MTETQTLRPEVLAFARQMEAALRQQDGDRGDDWQEEDLDWLVGRLDEEVEELKRAVDDLSDDGYRPQDRPLLVTDVITEAADVANFALFIAFVASRASVLTEGQT